MKTHEQFVKELHEINPDVAVIGKYTKAVEPVSVKCLVCGKEWTPKAYSLLQGKGCPSCSAHKGARNNKGKTGVKDVVQFQMELKKVDPSIEVIGSYVNGHSNIKCSCLRCGHTWEAKPYSLLQGHGCPRCAKSGTSFMEQSILLSFQSVLKDEVLSRDRKTIGMELDVYIPSLNFAVEVGNWYLHQKSVKRDKEKRIRCQEHGIRLVTVYDKYPKDKEPLFQEDFFGFEDDLNKTDHRIIRGLIQELFELVQIEHELSDVEWEKIEQEAYDRSKSMTHEVFVQRMSETHPTVEVLGKYENINRRVAVRCSVCGYTWEGVPASLLSGDGCRKCGTKKAHERFIRSQDDFEAEVKEKNPDVEIIGTYTGRHSPVKVRCKICGFEWSPKASSVLRGSSHKGSSGIHQKMKKPV